MNANYDVHPEIGELYDHDRDPVRLIYFLFLSANHSTHLLGGKMNRAISTTMMKKTNSRTARAMCLHLILTI